jgi:hypothetical protein
MNHRPLFNHHSSRTTDPLPVTSADPWTVLPFFAGDANLCANANGFIFLAWSFKLFYAIGTDSFRPFGMRRVPYMIAGWVGVLIMLFIIACRYLSVYLSFSLYLCLFCVCCLIYVLRSMYVCMYVYVCMCICMYLYIYIYVCVHMTSVTLTPNAAPILPPVPFLNHPFVLPAPHLWTPAAGSAC